MAVHGPTVGHYPVHLQHQPYPHYQAAAAAVAAAAAANAAPSVHMQQLMEQQAAEELRKSAKRAANRRSASTCRARKKFLVENMAEANSRMRKRSRVLSLLPDMILAMRRDGIITYASENCRQFLKFTREVRSVIGRVVSPGSFAIFLSSLWSHCSLIGLFACSRGLTTEFVATV